LKLVLYLSPGEVRSVPGAKVNWMRELPAELLVAEKYSILSKPVICCSMICVTVFSTVSAEAPGYVESMAIEGGAIGGYCDMGNL